MPVVVHENYGADQLIGFSGTERKIYIGKDHGGNRRGANFSDWGIDVSGGTSIDSAYLLNQGEAGSTSFRASRARLAALALEIRPNPTSATNKVYYGISVNLNSKRIRLGSWSARSILIRCTDSKDVLSDVLIWAESADPRITEATAFIGEILQVDASKPPVQKSAAPEKASEGKVISSTPAPEKASAGNVGGPCIKVGDNYTEKCRNLIFAANFPEERLEFKAFGACFKAKGEFKSNGIIDGRWQMTNAEGAYTEITLAANIVAISLNLRPHYNAGKADISYKVHVKDKDGSNEIRCTAEKIDIITRGCTTIKINADNDVVHISDVKLWVV